MYHRLFRNCILKVWPWLYDLSVCCVPPAQNDTSSRSSVKLRQPGEGVVAVQADGVCDFNWIPAFSSRPQVKPVVLVLPDLGFFSSQPPPVYSSPLFHSLICCSACATGYPLLPWLPYNGPLICAAVWSCGRWVPQCFMNLKSQNSPYLIFHPSDRLQSCHRPLILTAFFGHPVFSS